MERIMIFAKKFNIFFYIGLFIILFQPPLLPFNSIHIVGAISIVYIFLNSTNEVGRIRISKTIRSLYFIFSIISVYIFVFSILINKGSMNNLSFPIYFMIDVIPFSWAIKLYSCKHKLNQSDLFNMFITVGLLQAITAIVSFFVPQVQKIFIDSLLSYGYSSSLDVFSGFRIYGFSPFLTFGTPVIQSVLTALILFCKENKKMLDYFASFILFFSAIINARISIIILLLGFFSFLLSQKVSIKKKIFQLFLYVMVLGFVITVGSFLLRHYSLSTYEWILDGLKEIELIFNNDNANKYSYITYFTSKNTYKLPGDIIGILFGKGLYVMTGANNYSFNSDVGYINDIWFGGICYIILVYYAFYKMIIKILKSENVNYSRLGSLLLLLFPILNIKGIVFTMFSLTNFLMIIYVYINGKNMIYTGKKGE